MTPDDLLASDRGLTALGGSKRPRNARLRTAIDRCAATMPNHVDKSISKAAKRLVFFPIRPRC